MNITCSIGEQPAANSTLSPVNPEILNTNVRLTDRATRLNDYFHLHTPQIRHLNTPYSELDSIIIATLSAVVYKHTEKQNTRCMLMKPRSILMSFVSRQYLSEKDVA